MDKSLVAESFLGTDPTGYVQRPHRAPRFCSALTLPVWGWQSPSAEQRFHWESLRKAQCSGADGLCWALLGSAAPAACPVGCPLPLGLGWGRRAKRGGGISGYSRGNLCFA